MGHPQSSIPLAADFMEKVRDYTKTATIRRGRLDIALGYHEFQNVENPVDRATIKVWEVRYIHLRNLTTEMAERAGYQSVSDLVDDAYPPIGSNDEITIIRFLYPL